MEVGKQSKHAQARDLASPDKSAASAGLGMPMLPESSSDEQLMSAVQQGQHQQFAVLVGRHQQPMFRYAHSRLGSYALAEDAVQETFLAAFAHRDTYDCHRPFRPWLWTIAVNQCRRCARDRQRRREETTSAPVDQATVCDDPLAVVVSAERRQQRAALLAQLPPEQAETLQLRFFGQLRFEEIAQTTGVSVSTAKSRVRYALEKLSHLITQSTVEEWSSDP